MTPLLEVDDLTFSYGAVQVLFGISFHVDEGETLALLGTNGAGKSTLLQLVGGIARPQKGKIVFAGDDVTRAPAVDMVRRGSVLMLGGKAIFADLTVRENLEIGAYSLRRQPLVATDRIEQALAILPRLSERLSVRAGSLSGGEQQQLALAKALILKPRLLCIDELSLGLSPAVVSSLVGVVRELGANGTTVLVVEQSLNVAASLAPRALFLEKGAIRFEGPTAELLERDEIARAVFFEVGGTTSDAPNGTRRRPHRQRVTQ